MGLCEPLRWDTQFFGQRIGRVTVSRLSPETVDAILAWCADHEIRCLYFLADSDHAETVRLAEDKGFRFVDIRVTLEYGIAHGQCRHGQSSLGGLRVRDSTREDIPALQAIARISYRSSRFYNDPSFSPERCDALYETWIKRSCEGDANVVFVAELNSQPVGYASCHLSENASEGKIGLVGVASHARGRGVGQILVTHSLEWFAEKGSGLVTVVTQGGNISAQRLYQRCGFITHAVQLWYHKWLPESNQGEP